MKLPPDMQKLEKMLRSSKLVAGGFLGNDTRPLPEIIETDMSVVSRSGYTLAEIGKRMNEITRQASGGQGMAVAIGDNLEAVVDDSRGRLVCPWPGEDTFLKRSTTVTRKDTGKQLRWSDLSIHLIQKHGFFQGIGSPYRLDPKELIETIFPVEGKHMNQFICQVCGNIYDPARGDTYNLITPGTPFEQLPDTWVCPMCGAPKRMYKRK
jgi:rubredoxin